MTHILHLWDARLACPTSLASACQQLEQLSAQSPGVNPNFLALVLALSVNGVQSVTQPRWLRSRNEESRALTGAVWRMYTPEDEAAQILPAVVDHATGLGLVVLSQALDLVFLPGGRVLPDDPRAPGTPAAVRIAGALRAGQPGTLVRMGNDLQTLLAPHGFAPQPAGSDGQVRFARAVERGTQEVSLLVKSAHGVDHADVWCSLVDAPLEAVFAEVFAPPARGPVSFFFTPGAFRGHRFGHITVENAAQRQAVIDDVARHGLPVLDLARSLPGLDRLMNQRQLFPYSFPGLDPRAPQTLADDAVNVGRLGCLKVLVAAHLAGNPQFEQRVEDLRRFVQGRADVTEAQLDQLVAHLRDRRA